MSDVPNEDHDYYAIGDRIEALAELAIEMPELVDRHHNREGTLETAGIDETSLSVPAELALDTIARSADIFVDGVQDLIAAARRVGYEEGFHDGLADAAVDLGTEEDDEASSS